MVKGVMRMTAAKRSEYRPKCVIDMKILTTTVEDYCILCHDKTRRERKFEIKFEKCEKNLSIPYKEWFDCHVGIRWRLKDMCCEHM